MKTYQQPATYNDIGLHHVLEGDILTAIKTEKGGVDNLYKKKQLRV